MFSFRTISEIIASWVLQYALSYVQPRLGLTDMLIRASIIEKRLVACDYEGYFRIIELHTYGTYKGKTGILAYQLWGESSRGELGWKRMHLAKMRNMTILDKTFSGKRDVSGEHTKWDIVYMLVDE